MKLFSTDIVNQVINHWVIDSWELDFNKFVFSVYPWLMHFIASFLISTIGIKTWQWLILFTNCQTLDPANTEMSKHLFQECIMLSVVIREKAVSFQFLVIYCHAIYLIDFWKFLFSSSSVMGKDEKIDILHLLPYLYVTLRYHGDQMSSCDMSI